MNVSLLDSTVDPLFVISMCARTCYNSRNKDDINTRAQFVKGLIRSGHTSVLENAIATFDIKGISRACQNQIVRHRIGCSYCVQSMRYVNVEDNEIIIPRKLFMEWPDATEAANEIRKMYKELLNIGVPKEDARYLLPLGTSTNMTMTMNFRAIRHFLKLRLDKKAQWEVQQVAYAIYKICLSNWPWLVEDLDYEQ